MRRRQNLRIAVLAWGSLVWDRQDLAVATVFNPTGPVLPVEFCRVSRDGRLTLVIDEKVGIPCVAYYALSAFDDLNAAIENLRGRENMPDSKGVGFIAPSCNVQGTIALKRHPQANKTIAAWAYTGGFDAVIWTALGSNFKEKTKKPFSVNNAIRYLEARSEKPLENALKYIRLAPVEIRTPVREAVEIRWPRSNSP